MSLCNWFVDSNLSGLNGLVINKQIKHNSFMKPISAKYSGTKKFYYFQKCRAMFFKLHISNNTSNVQTNVV
jgi:hypothetical protein